MAIIGTVIGSVLWIFLLVLFARMILSWIPVLVRDWQPRGPMLVAAEVIYSVTDPPLRALRKVLKPVRVGNMMLDLAFIGSGDRRQHPDAGQRGGLLLSRRARLLGDSPRFTTLYPTPADCWADAGPEHGFRRVR